jgi:UDP-N-acetylmuramate--alanine ligase
MSLNIDKNKKLHFIGIGGIGMCGLAEYFLLKGYKVSGSDISDSYIINRLRELGADIHIGHSSDNIDNETGFIVYTAAVKKDNPEIKKAEELGIKFLKRAEVLGEVVNDKFLIAVAGTHGKTTTTAMIGKMLMDSGFDPTIFVGGNVSVLNGAASRIGASDFAVVEADEYDRSFLTLKADIIVITNIDEDHLDIYKDLDDIKNTFRKFCEQSKENSNIIYYGDDKNISSFIHGVNRNKLSYGFNPDNSLNVENIHRNGKLMFDISNSQNNYEDISLNVIGTHNILNSTACFAVAKLFKIDFSNYKKSIESFNTVDRRLQLKYKNSVIVYDDYAHHPVEIEFSLNALKDTYTGKKITAVFQPHLYSRTRDFYKDFAEKLKIADEIVLLDIYPAREKPIENITSGLIYDELVKNNSAVKYFHDKKDVINHLSGSKSKGSVIVFIGAGDITLICDEFVKQTEVKKN